MRLALIVVSLPFLLVISAAAIGVENTRLLGSTAEVIIFSCLYWGLAVLFIFAASKIHKLWPSYLIGVCSGLIFLVIAELAFRSLYSNYTINRLHTQPSEQYHHIFPPHHTLFLGENSLQKIYAYTNQDGLRTHYSRDEFKEKNLRIALLGDSFVFGQALPKEDILSEKLEQQLKHRLQSDQVAVLNAGIISYSPLLEFQLFEGIVKHYRPNLVLLLLDASDIGDDIKYNRDLDPGAQELRFKIPEVASASSSPSALIQALFLHPNMLTRWLRFPRLAAQVLRGQTPTAPYNYYDFGISVAGGVETDRFFIFRHPLEVTRPYFEKTLAQIDRIAAAVQAQQSRFVLVVLPRYQHWNKAEAPQNWELRNYQLDEQFLFEYFRFFDEARSKAPYPIFSLLPTFQATREYPLVFPADPHWNAAGHTFVAKALAEYLLVEQLVPKLD